MSQYLLSVMHTAADYAEMENLTAEEVQPMFDAVGAFNDRLRSEGAWVFGGGLQPPETTTGVDNTGDAPVLVDGPFVETKEAMGGFWVIEAVDLDAALEWAKAGSAACGGRLEVRPFQDA